MKKSLKLAIIGSSVQGSLSQVLQTFFGNKFDVDVSYDLVNLPENCDDKTLLDAIMRYDGVNITMPFKNRVAQILNYDGAVNTVKVSSSSIKACSTDGLGVILALDYYGIDIVDKNLLIIGAGGSAQEAIEALSFEGANIFVVDRTPERAKTLTEKYGLLTSRPKNFEGILSFTPLYDQLPDVDYGSIDDVKFVFDANYKHPTALLNKAKKADKMAIDGLSMLFYQGIVGFCYWSGIEIDDCGEIDKMYEEFIKIVKDSCN